MTRSARTALGLLAVVPAFVALLVSYVWPTVWTAYHSGAVWSEEPFPDQGSDWSHAVPDFVEGAGHALVVAVVPLVAVLGVAPLVAWAASRAGTTVRRVVRALLALPLAYVGSAALWRAWEADDLLAPTGSWSGRSLAWVSTFAVAAALAATVYLSALRPGRPGHQPARTLAVLATVAALTVVALSLQAFTATWLSAERHTGPLTALFVDSFQLLDVPRGAAVATLLLAVLMALGLAATLLLVRAGVRAEPADPNRAEPAQPVDLDAPPPMAAMVTPPPRPASSGAVAGALAGAGVLLLVLFCTVWPWLRALAGGELSMPVPPGFDGSRLDVLAYGWLPTLAPALVGVVLAALAGYGIGALRPFGARSELLLLPFAPWLFVGFGPLALHAYYTGPQALTHDSDLVPPLWLNIPVLLVATLYFRGAQRNGARGRARRSGAGVLLFGALFLVSWQALSQNTLWWLLRMSSGRPTPMRALFGLGAYDHVGTEGIGLASPPPILLVVLAVLIAVQVLVVDRLRVTAGPRVDA